MATVEQIVSRAFRKMGVSGTGNALTDEEIAEGVDALNMMIHAWRLEGVELSWTDQAATEVFSLPSEYHEGVVYLLASRLSPDYQVPPSFNADTWFRSIQAWDFSIGEADIPGGISRLPSQYDNPKRSRLY